MQIAENKKVLKRLVEMAFLVGYPVRDKNKSLISTLKIEYTTHRHISYINSLTVDTPRPPKE